MPATSRREFLTLAGSASVLALSAAGFGAPPAMAAMGPDDKFDLVIKGGEVLDPSQSLRAKRDIGIASARSRRLRPTFPPTRA